MKAKLTTHLGATIALLLVTSVRAKKQYAGPLQSNATGDYAIVANLTDQNLPIKFKKTESDVCQSFQTTLAAGTTIEHRLNCKLKYLKVGTQTVSSLNLDKAAMFLIELDESGRGFMLTPFVNDQEGWIGWRDGVIRAKAKLYAKKSADLLRERDEALAQENARYKELEATFDLDAEMKYGPGSGGRMMYTDQREAHRLNKLNIQNRYDEGIKKITSLIKY